MTGFMVVIHTYPPFAVASPLFLDEIRPLDSEGEIFCPRIPVVTGKPGTEDLAGNVGQGLHQAPVVIARGHGRFAFGKTLDEAYFFHLTCRTCLSGDRAYTVFPAVKKR